MIGKILAIFTIWRIFLFFIAFLATNISGNFGRLFPYYDTLLQPTQLPPWILNFANFDGVHYLRIALNGYSDEYTQAFFPLYPILIKLFSYLLYPLRNTGYIFSAFLVSNIAFIIGSYFYIKLIKIDYSDKIAFKSLILLVAFPTAYYFLAAYTESLFFMLVVMSFYYMRTKHFILAGILIGLVSATRVLGILLFPILIYEIIVHFKSSQTTFSDKVKAFLGVTVAPSGLILYMIYLKLNFDNAIYFITAQPSFGAARVVGEVILLPQVIYRYLKILLTVPPLTGLFFNAVLELMFTVFVLMLLILAFKRTRLSYWLFSLGCVLIPTLTGTFLSMPRFVLMTMLLFPVLSKMLKNEKLYLSIILVLVVIEILLVSLFTRGYWIS